MIKNKSSPIKEAIYLTKLWQEHGPNTYPLDINELIKKGLNNSSFNGLLSCKTMQFDSIEGILIRTEGTDCWTVLLNNGLNNKRRMRFTHAHELGHFMCHRNLQDRFEDTVDTLNDFKNKGIEVEANTFASWLLMPSNIIRSEFDKVSWNIGSLCEIANRFECSLQASAIRFVELASKPIAFVVSRDGIINWSCKSNSAPYRNAFCRGDELPELSNACKSSSRRGINFENEQSGYAWSKVMRAKESQYFDRSGNDYQYTCIEFEE